MSNVLKYKDFIGSVEFSADDDCFFGKLIGVNDLVTFEGKSTDELREAFQDAVDDYMDICERNGKKPLRSYIGIFNVRINPELHKEAALYAAAHGQSLNAFVAQSIEDRLRHSARQ